MKIISGIYKGRNLTGFNIEGTRPTQDRVKESIFSSIQGYLQDAIVLDLFAGSGNLGLEALSNGSKFAYLNDANRKAVSAIKKNIELLKVENAKVLELDYKKALSYFKENNITFDIVFLDPPYKDEIIEETVTYLLENNLLNEDAIIICEYEHDFNDDFNDLEIIKEKKYGYKFVKILAKI